MLALPSLDPFNPLTNINTHNLKEIIADGERGLPQNKSGLVLTGSYAQNVQ